MFHVFRNVAEGTCGDGLREILGGFRLCQHHDAGRRVGGPDAAERFDAVDALHRDIEQADIRLQLLPEPHALQAIGGLASNVKAGLGAQEVGEPGPHHRMVIDEQEADRGEHGSFHRRATPMPPR